MKKTKIIATIGPSSDNIDVLRRLFTAGVNVVRINMSHSSHEDALKAIKLVRQLSEKIAILIDTRGPEIRTSPVDQIVEIFAGDDIVVRGGEGTTDKKQIVIDFDGLASVIVVGSFILVADGQIELRVQKVEGDNILCRVNKGGKIGSRKGVNVPSLRLPIPFLTEQDKKDIAFAVEQQVDFIAASFVNDRQDIKSIRTEMGENGKNICLISKVESRYAVNNLDEIVEESDAIMIARGDLGVEISPEEVPIVQKRIIEMSRQAGKNVIVATEMLESMIHNPRPTRAETSDVANAIFEGTDALMLSAETSVGDYPVESVQTMSRIARISEGEFTRFSKDIKPGNKVTEIICKAAWLASQDLEVQGIIVPTSSGRTAVRVSRYRPRAPILATTPDQRVARRLSLCYGVYALPTGHDGRLETMVRRSCSLMVKSGLLERDDLTVVVCGVPVGRTGTTNLLTIQRVSDIIGKESDGSLVLEGD